MRFEHNDAHLGKKKKRIDETKDQQHSFVLLADKDLNADTRINRGTQKIMRCIQLKDVMIEHCDVSQNYIFFDFLALTLTLTLEEKIPFGIRYF